MEKRKVLLFALIVSVVLTAMFLRVEAQTVSLDALLKGCEKKVQHYGLSGDGPRRAVKVGESIDYYCKGVLEGMFAILIRNKTICLKDRPSHPDFLLSIILTYQAETKSQDNDAASVVEAAFKRAFSCSN